MSQDAACKGNNTAETIVVDGGNLANVFVYVKDGLGNRTFDVPKDAVTIDQQGCKYHPHVLGVMAGQNIEIKNDDQTTHNIHPTPQRQPRVERVAAAEGSRRIEKNFAREEIMLPVKCNQHPVDEDVRQRGEEPVLRGHRQGSASTRSRACRRATTPSPSCRKNWASRIRKSRWPPRRRKTVDQSFKAAPTRLTLRAFRLVRLPHGGGS